MSHFAEELACANVIWHVCLFGLARNEQIPVGWAHHLLGNGLGGPIEDVKRASGNKGASGAKAGQSVYAPKRREPQRSFDVTSEDISNLVGILSGVHQAYDGRIDCGRGRGGLLALRA